MIATIRPFFMIYILLLFKYLEINLMLHEINMIKAIKMIEEAYIYIKIKYRK